MPPSAAEQRRVHGKHRPCAVLVPHETELLDHELINGTFNGVQTSMADIDNALGTLDGVQTGMADIDNVLSPCVGESSLGPTAGELEETFASVWPSLNQWRDPQVQPSHGPESEAEAGHPAVLTTADPNPNTNPNPIKKPNPKSEPEPEPEPEAEAGHTAVLTTADPNPKPKPNTI